MNNDKITNELVEEWREYNGYHVSNFGKVINKNGKALKIQPSKDGYVHTAIKDYDGKWIRGLHRVVATVFIPNPNNLPEVNHIDGVKTNNKLNNLEWVTKKENQIHASYILGKRLGEDCTRSILKEKQVIEIYELCKSRTLYYKEIAEMYNVKPQEVSDIALGEYWKGLKLEPLPKITRWDIVHTKQQIKL